VGIFGSGLMGGKLGTIFARAGHEVVFSYARSEQKLKRLARDANGKTFVLQEPLPPYGAIFNIENAPLRQNNTAFWDAAADTTES
jgi:predicted dinucleotide-binding enzyme